MNKRRPCTPPSRSKWTGNVLPWLRQGASRKPWGVPERRSFSLMEILVVVAIIALVLALVVPKVGRIPKRLAVARSLTTIRRAMRETGMRARTSGQTIRLCLNLDEKRFELHRVSDAQIKEFFVTVPGRRGTQPQADTGSGETLQTGESAPYDIPEEVEWDSAFMEYNGDIGPNFIFFPNGEASGEPLEFAVEGRRFRLDVDRLIGTPIITETITR